MNSSDQRRKRKRILRQPYSPSRSILTCFAFLTFLYLLSHTVTSPAFRPVLAVPRLSAVLYSSISRTVKSVQDFDGLGHPLRIQSRVLFPDHVLLLVSGELGSGVVRKSFADELECVYFGDKAEKSGDFDVKKVLSVDEYDGFGWIVRCPVPSGNYSAVVELKRVSKNGIFVEKKDGFFVGNGTVGVRSWDNVAYAAVLDGESVVVFVKGLNLRADRDSDPSVFSCHFGLGKWENDGRKRFMFSTKALTAAQEVVRCSLPKIISRNLDKARGIRVAIGSAHRPIHSRSGHGIELIPSIAKISDLRSDGGKRIGAKYELCACTMVWNQASAIREWIAYHSWLGMERWFIYDNNSDDVIDEVVQELDRDNYNVTRHVWPWIKTQEAGFSHCALRAKEECNWVAFMDVDEYFYLPYSTPRHQSFRELGYAAQNSLRSIVANFTSSTTVGEIRTSCHSFGPSGLKSRPIRGVTVGYTCRLKSPERHKSIVRLDALDRTLLNVVHHFHLRKGFEYVNLPMSTAMINHYKYQVWEVFRAKFYRRVATYVADWRESQNEGSRDRAPGLGTEAIEPPDWPQRFCEVWDTGLRDFVLTHLEDVSTGLLPWERASN